MKRKPVILENCISSDALENINNADFVRDILMRENMVHDETLKNQTLNKIIEVLNRKSSLNELKRRYQEPGKEKKQLTWTHSGIPEEDDKSKLKDILQRKDLRTFLKVTNIKPNISCYENV